MKLSCAIPSRNSGAFVAPTLKSIVSGGADEIILVDDASADGSCELEAVKALGLPVTLVRHERPFGVAGARNHGLALATGDWLAVSDAHVEAPAGALREMARLAAERQAIVCAATEAMNRPNTRIAYGGRIYLPNVWNVLLNGSPPKPEPNCPELARINALYGSVYVWPRSVHERMGGGWVRTIGRGYNEAIHSMLAFFCDVPIYVYLPVRFKHHCQLFRRGDVRSYEWNWRDCMLNVILACYVLFEQATFAGYWRPTIQSAMARYGIRPDEICTAEWRAERERVQPLKIKTDAEFFKYFSNGNPP